MKGYTKYEIKQIYWTASKPMKNLIFEFKKASQSNEKGQLISILHFQLAVSPEAEAFFALICSWMSLHFCERSSFY